MSQDEYTSVQTNSALFKLAKCRACGFAAHFKSTVDQARGVRHCMGGRAA